MKVYHIKYSKGFWRVAKPKSSHWFWLLIMCLQGLKFRTLWLSCALIHPLRTDVLNVGVCTKISLKFSKLYPCCVTFWGTGVHRQVVVILHSHLCLKLINYCIQNITACEQHHQSPLVSDSGPPSLTWGQLLNCARPQLLQQWDEGKQCHPSQSSKPGAPLVACKGIYSYYLASPLNLSLGMHHNQQESCI